jgi:hypothetical protein
MSNPLRTARLWAKLERESGLDALARLDQEICEYLPAGDPDTEALSVALQIKAAPEVMVAVECLKDVLGGREGELLQRAAAMRAKEIPGTRLTAYRLNDLYQVAAATGVWGKVIEAGTLPAVWLAKQPPLTSPFLEMATAILNEQDLGSFMPTIEDDDSIRLPILMRIANELECDIPDHSSEASVTLTGLFRRQLAYLRGCQHANDLRAGEPDGVMEFEHAKMRVVEDHIMRMAEDRSQGTAFEDAGTQQMRNDAVTAIEQAAEQLGRLAAAAPDEAALLQRALLRRLMQGPLQ